MDDACGLFLFSCHPLPIYILLTVLCSIKDAFIINIEDNQTRAHVDCNRANTYCVGIEPLCIPDEREQSPAVHHSSRQNADLSTAIYGTLADQYHNF
ncbi:uncharacterized protein BO88DRAFT_403933 [Aspergillus vadensis CBS 113365]|uniref:Uncharacterized protein n=1 Tax=Aspergillus vadensis (strain CBS 113365 / IMI 142717 / IBT 24658) TaxID=1448311 RepID=A0A319BDI1_ASPVC|nr:hypothetical protein BO88DRAFT_403933 [Aspergillus vadensis CBS 113365]PYH70299.1 hypothetical protein BO88DRAFT_403933 [Aspergillus vadensis CBS 113365]